MHHIPHLNHDLLKVWPVAACTFRLIHDPRRCSRRSPHPAHGLVCSLSRFLYCISPFFPRSSLVHSPPSLLEPFHHTLHVPVSPRQAHPGRSITLTTWMETGPCAGTRHTEPCSNTSPRLRAYSSVHGMTQDRDVVAGTRPEHPHSEHSSRSSELGICTYCYRRKGHYKWSDAPVSLSPTYAHRAVMSVPGCVLA